MNQKLPYYMAYPMPLAYDDERVERMDLEYMKRSVTGWNMVTVSSMMSIRTGCNYS